MNESMKHLLDIREKTLSVTVPGDVLSTNADALREDLFGLLDSPPVKHGDWDTLKLDLTAAQMVDSVGLNLIVAIVRNVKNRNGRIVTTLKSPNIHRTFLFTRLDKQMELVKV